MLIGKYVLKETLQWEFLYLPLGAEIKHFGRNPHNHKEWAFWAMIDELEEKRKQRRFAVVATGYKVPSPPQFITYHGSHALYECSEIWHLIEAT